jgi:hypothetical protein
MPDEIARLSRRLERILERTFGRDAAFAKTILMAPLVLNRVSPGHSPG